MNPILLMSGVEIAAAIRTGQLTSVEAVEAHIAHIKAVNPTLNAVVHERFETARLEAREADAHRDDAGPDRPFHGVPCTIKECFALEKMPWTSGLVARRGVFADRDATTVERVRAAGAIPLGVTNVSELCMWMESYNRVYGRTRNPYNPGRIVGGSSGGEGAIVGSGASPFGLGSDVGGSIRMPAFFNGVFGHKPTGGLVPSTGQYPAASGPALRYLTTGPLARKAEDLMPLLQVMAGPDGHDTGALAWSLGDPGTVSLEGMTVLSVEGNGFRKVSGALNIAQRRAASALQRRGAKVRTAQFGRLKRSLEMWSLLLNAAGGPKFGTMLGDGVHLSAKVLCGELLKFALGRSEFTLPALGLALIEEIPALGMLNPEDLDEITHEANALKTELLEQMGPNGVLLYPSYTRTAPRHGMPILTPMDWVYTAVFNVMEMPVTQVPLGLDRHGLPLGVQVVGAHGQDHRTIAVAMALEEAMGGWVPPWTVNRGGATRKLR